MTSSYHQFGDKSIVFLQIYKKIVHNGDKYVNILPKGDGNMDLKKFIGEKIKEFRTKRDMTQDELAVLLGTTKQTVSRYEKGDRQANQDVLFQLSNVFNVSIDEFFPKKENVTNEFERALKMTEGLDAEDMEFLNKLIEKTLSLEGEEREKFLESIRFTIEYYNKMN